MDPIQIINKAINDLDQELKKDQNVYKENLYMHMLSIFSNKIIEKIIETKLSKFIKILEHKNQEHSIKINESIFTLSTNQKEFVIIQNGVTILKTLIKTTPQEHQLIKIALKNNVYKTSEEIAEAQNLIKKRFECETTLEDIQKIQIAFNDLDEEFFKIN